MRLTNAAPGNDAEAQFDVILAGVSAAGPVGWNLTADAGTAAGLEVYSLATIETPRLVDRFTATSFPARFSTDGSLLDSHGQLTVAPMPHLVLAHYYPWYTPQDWDTEPDLIDRPLVPYSTDSQDDTNRIAREVRAAGIDALVVSWQGKTTGGGFNARRMRIVLNAARAASLQACAYIETYVANPAMDPNAPTDPATMRQWIADIVDLYGRDPAYLRVMNRPLVFVYSASRISHDDWAALRAALRASGRDPLLVGDFYHSTLLDEFDGEYQYSNVLQTSADLRAIDRVESLRVRTFNLLRPSTERRRLWIASVAPGYDDRHIATREVHYVTPRASGAVYDDQWKAAVETAADWVIVTSWNEWRENTEIEPGRLYGTFYLLRTRFWSSAFTGFPALRRPAAALSPIASAGALRTAARTSEPRHSPRSSVEDGRTGQPRPHTR
jgi:hypothetical protein